MKKCILVALLFCSDMALLGQGVLLGPGQSYVFEFTSLPYWRPVGPGETYAGHCFMSLDPASYAQSGRVELDCFANSLSDTPRSAIWNLPLVETNPNVQLGVIWPNGQPLWPDLQGVVKVTALSGDILLLGIAPQELVGGNVYGGIFISAPEPSALALLAAGVACLYVWRVAREKATKFRTSSGRRGGPRGCERA